VPVKMCKAAGEALAPKQSVVEAEILALGSAVAEVQELNMIAAGRIMKQNAVEEGCLRAQLDTSSASHLDRLKEL